MDFLASCVQQVKVPSQNDNIYNEECVFSFDNPVNCEISPTKFV